MVSTIYTILVGALFGMLAGLWAVFGPPLFPRADVWLLLEAFGIVLVTLAGIALAEEVLDR